MKSAEQSKPIAQDAYNAIAEAYAAVVDTKPHNAYYERPATSPYYPMWVGRPSWMPAVGLACILSGW